MWTIMFAQLFTFTLMMSENAIAYSWRDDFYFVINSSDQLQDVSTFKKSLTIQHFIVRILMWLILYTIV